LQQRVVDNMTISNTAQFGLLLWKNWILQKRRKVVTAFQILIPVLFAIILLLIRRIVDSEFIPSPNISSSFEASTSLPVTPPTLTLNRTLPDDPKNMSRPSTAFVTTHLNSTHDSLLSTATPGPTSVPSNRTLSEATTTLPFNVTHSGVSTSFSNLTLSEASTSFPANLNLPGFSMPSNMSSSRPSTPDRVMTMSSGPDQSTKWRIVYAPRTPPVMRMIESITQMQDTVPIGKLIS